MNFLDYNGDGNINFNDFYDIIKDLMKEQEKTNKNGDEKLENVKMSLKLMFGVQTYQKFEVLIDPAIEFIHRCYFLKKKCCFKK